MSTLCRVDDKLVPLYRIMWIAATPHFCGDENCTREGFYEVRLEQEESVWSNEKEKDQLLEKLEAWQGGLGPSDEQDW